MPNLTRIKNNQITDNAIDASTKLAPNSISASKLANNITYGSNLIISGNLTVNGATTSVDTTTTTVEDPILLLSMNATGAPSVDIGILGKRGSSNAAFMGWQESSDKFIVATTADTDSSTTINVASFADFAAYSVTANTTISATGNVSGGNVSGTAGTFTNVYGTIGTAAQTSITSVGTLTSLAVTGNVSAGNVSATGIAGTLSTAAQASITSVGTLTSLAVTGNVSTGNVSGTAGTFTNVYGTIGTAAQASITSLGTLTSLAVTGNITGNYILGNGSQLTGLPATYGNANVVANLAALGSNPISTTGNVTAGNIIGNISITGNVTGTSANVTLVAGAYSTVFDNTGNTVFANGTVSVTTLTASGNISATGSILATPAWTSAGAITLTATTTSPTKGTTTSDNISYRQLGAKQWEIILTYIQTVANGVNGSGDYLVTLPNSLSFDTTLPSQQITTTNIGTNTYALMSYIIPSGSGLINNDSLGGQVYPIVYDATKFRILTTSYSSDIQCWGSGYYALGGDDPKIQLTFRFTST